MARAGTRCTWHSRVTNVPRDRTSVLEQDIQVLLRKELKKPAHGFPDIEVEEGQTPVIVERGSRPAGEDWSTLSTESTKVQSFRGRCEGGDQDEVKLTVRIEQEEAKASASTKSQSRARLLKKVAIKLWLQDKSAAGQGFGARSSSKSRGGSGGCRGSQNQNFLSGIVDHMAVGWPTPTNDLEVDPEVLPLGTVEATVLAHFLGSSACDTQCAMCASRLHRDSVTAAAAVVTKACVRVICNMNEPSCGWACTVWRSETDSTSPRFSYKCSGVSPAQERGARTWDDVILEQDSESLSEWEPSLWDGSLRAKLNEADESSKLWEAVWTGDNDELRRQHARLQQSADGALKWCYLLHQRRKFKVANNPKILTGQVLLLACVRWENESDPVGGPRRHTLSPAQDIVGFLLETKADPCATYDLFPCGAQSAFVGSPLCFIARKLPLLKMLQECHADLDAESTCNYHAHNDLLREATWSRNDVVAKFALDNCHVGRTGSKRWSLVREMVEEGANFSRGWDSDFPPLSDGSCMHRYTAFGRALSMQMECFHTLLAATRLWAEHEFEHEITLVLPKMCPEDLSLILSEVDPSKLTFLLRIPASTIVQVHPKRLEEMWLTLKGNEKTFDKFQKAIKEPQRQQGAMEMVTKLVEHAPRAAQILLDCFILQVPHVKTPNRNPLATKADIHRPYGMNTVSTSTCVWDMDMKRLNAQVAWQRMLTRVGPGAEWAQPALQFCDIRVVQLRGILHAGIIHKLAQSNSHEQAALLQDCTTLRALVLHTYGTWGRFRCFLGLESAVQLLVLLHICTTESPGSESELFFLWLIFSAPALSSALYDCFFFGEHSGLSARSFPAYRPLLYSLSNVPAHACCLHLVTLNWHEHGLIELRRQHTPSVTIVLLAQCLEILKQLSRETRMGQLLIPMTDAFGESSMLSMLFLLLFCWIASVAFLHAVASYSEEAVFEHTILRTWVNLVVGEPVMIDTENFEKPWYDLALISIVSFLFQVVLLNVLLATTMTTYSSMSSCSLGRQLRARMAACRNWLSERDRLRIHFTRWFGSSSSRVKFWIFVALVLVAVFVSFSDEPPLRLILLLAVTAPLFWCRLHCMKLSPLVSTEDHEGKKPQSSDTAFLWVCQIKEETITPESLEKKVDGLERKVEACLQGVSDLHGLERKVDTCVQGMQDLQRDVRTLLGGGRRSSAAESPERGDRDAPSMAVAHSRSLPALEVRPTSSSSGARKALMQRASAAFRAGVAA